MSRDEGDGPFAKIGYVPSRLCSGESYRKQHLVARGEYHEAFAVAVYHL